MKCNSFQNVQVFFQKYIFLFFSRFLFCIIVQRALVSSPHLVFFFTLKQHNDFSLVPQNVYYVWPNQRVWIALLLMYYHTNPIQHTSSGCGRSGRSSHAAHFLGGIFLCLVGLEHGDCFFHLLKDTVKHEQSTSQSDRHSSVTIWWR